MILSWISLNYFYQVCQNVGKILQCMTVGRTVVLLNLEELYESLYDTLNQYFSCDKKMVDIGLGSQRKQAVVNDTFR